MSFNFLHGLFVYVSSMWLCLSEVRATEKVWRRDELYLCGMLTLHLSPFSLQGTCLQPYLDTSCFHVIYFDLCFLICLFM